MSDAIDRLEDQDELDGIEPGTSNNIYYLSIYVPITFDRVAVERQNLLCKGVWKDWMKKYPGWKNLMVYTDRQPGPKTIIPGSPEAQQLIWMRDFLVNNRVLPPRPRPIHASISELEDDPPDKLLDAIRWDLAKLRGKLADLARAYPGWKESLEAPQGGITCAIVTLADRQEEMAKHYKEHGHNPPWLIPIKETECTTK